MDLTDRDLYKCYDGITPPLKVPHTVTVVGTGAFGSWVSLFAALAGVKRLILINPGTPEGTGEEDIHEREIAVGPYRLTDMHHPKVAALAELVRSCRPQIDVVTHMIVFNPRESDHVSLLEGDVFSGISNEKLFAETWKAAVQRGLRCFGGGYNGTSVAVFSSEMPSHLKIGGNEIPLWVGSAALSAALALHSAIVSPLNYLGSLSELQLDSLGLSERATRDSISI